MKIIKLPFKLKVPALACGADIKGAFALAAGDTAYLIDGFGDLGDADNLESFERSVLFHEKKLRIRPRLIIRDSHPGYYSGRFAVKHKEALGAEAVREVQHHEAHVGSAIVDHSLKGEVIGIAFDGTGYGLDGNIWGGEIFTGNLRVLTRSAHFDYVPMPGADAAVSEPWRMAASYLYKAFGDRCLRLDLAIARKIGKARWAVVRKMVYNNINSPLTSSVGRLFDAVACMVFCRDGSVGEAELPVEFESIASSDCDASYGFDIVEKDGGLIVMTDKLIRGVAGDLGDKTDRSLISAKFHNTIAAVIAEVSGLLSGPSGIRKAVLSGGVFQNSYLTERAVSALGRIGLRAYVHSKVDASDNGIPIGQLAIAGRR